MGQSATVGAVDRAEQRAEAEVVFPEPRQLAVGVHPAAAHGGREVVHVADVEPVARLLAGPERARVEPRIGPEKVALHELDLVVGVVGDEVVRGLELDQTVPAPLEDRPPSGRPR